LGRKKGRWAAGRREEKLGLLGLSGEKEGKGGVGPKGRGRGLRAGVGFLFCFFQNLSSFKTL
jgi:hypothetical protein